MTLWPSGSYVSGARTNKALPERVHDTLFAAVADESRSDVLLRGRLAEERRPSGFGFAAAAFRTAATRGTATGRLIPISRRKTPPK